MKKIILAGILLFLGMVGVNAATFSSTFIGGYHYVDSEGRWGDFEKFYRTDNQKVVYCIEPGVSLTKEEYEEYQNLSSEELANKVGLTKEKLNKISLYAHYGYGYKNHTDNTWFVATQAKIWSLLGRNYQFTSQNNPSNPWAYTITVPNEIQSKMNELDSLVNNYLKIIQKLDKQHYDILIGGKVTIDDNKLRNFVLDKSYEDVTLNDSVLVISPKTAKELTEINLTFKEESAWAENFIVYHSNIGQDLLQPGNLNQTITITYKVESGSIKINKYDANTKSCNATGTATLDGAVYGIFTENNTLRKELTIKNCTASITGLELGRYYIKEIKSPNGYELDSKKYYFSIDRTTVKELQVFTLYDTPKETELKINKTYLIENNIALPEEGATFDIVSNTTKKVVSQITTDKQGNASAFLPYDTYTLVQKTGKENYIFIEDKVFSIDSNTSKSIEMNLTNEPYLGQLTIYKYDNNTKSCNPTGAASLENAIYGIYKKDGTLIEKLTIQNCTATSSSLLLGEYYIQELESPYGYQLDDKKYSFHLTKENISKALELTFYDIPKEIELKINKKYLEEKNISLPEEGVIFDIISNTTKKVVTQITTDKQGNANTFLPYDTYTLVQKTGKENYIFSENKFIKIDDSTLNPIEISLLNQPYMKKIKIIKVEKNSNKRIFQSNIEFKIYDLNRKKYVCENENCTFKTNLFGEFMTSELFPSTYLIEELKKENIGYLWNDEKLIVELNKDSEDITILEFENEKVLGNITVYKANEDRITLEGVEFALYAKETIYDVDKKIIYEKDERIATQKTDKYGKIIFENLPLGKYYIKETTSLQNYLLDNNCYDIELKYMDETTKIVTSEISLINYRVPNTIKNSSTFFPIIIPLCCVEGLKYYEKKNHTVNYFN